ncbi:MAG: cupin domain-containing protein [Alphaproteobacteria bacterium]|nr:cupin domain-containing protein [Alphaproteobacteria bacterium]
MAASATTEEADGGLADGDGPLVGARIRRLRQENGLTLSELAQRSGISVGMLSQIERDLANPSLRTLTRIRMALAVPLSALFAEDEPPSSAGDPEFVRRAARRPRLDLGPELVVKELLSSAAAVNMQFMVLNIPPGGGSGESVLMYPAEKAGLVLEGRFSLRVGEQEATLEEGDSFQFDSALPHRFWNESDRPVRVLWIIGQTLPERHL